MTDIQETLYQTLLEQPFTSDENEQALLNKYNQLAVSYSVIENSLAVLSDLKSNKSYIYFGGVAQTLGIARRYTSESIHSIWEEDIFERIHPEDLAGKHLLELQFFELLRSLPVEARSDYQIMSNLRIRERSGDYRTILHRMFYVCSCPSGNLWLALCLYNFSQNAFAAEKTGGVIINSAAGLTIDSDPDRCGTILSSREKEVLLLIEKGYRSRDIAEKMSISKNTVSRHRQNILQKLRVKNSPEACRIAKLMGLV